jgi:hypothetical protein
VAGLLGEQGKGRSHPFPISKMGGEEDNSSLLLVGSAEILHSFEENMMMNVLFTQPGNKENLRRHSSQVAEGQSDDLFPFSGVFLRKGQGQVPPGDAPMAVVEQVEKPAQPFKKKYPP